jgi:hypothetical protein
MYRKKRNKRSDAHDVMDKTFKSIAHALRLSGINIPKNALLPSHLPALVSSSEEEDMDGSVGVLDRQPTTGSTRSR